jgi:hypothetical protein
MSYKLEFSKGKNSFETSHSTREEAERERKRKVPQGWKVKRLYGAARPRPAFNPFFRGLRG